MTVAAGTKLGHYEILSPIGAGGMGEVHLARDTKLDRDVAVKVLPDRVAADSEALARFEREAKAVAAVSHPNVLAIYDFGTDRGITYIVTELLEGETLRQRLQRSTIPWRKAIEVGTAVADGLAAAHAKGIIHRDLKPENIFLTADGVVKILDFGLARVQHASGSDDRTMTLDTKPGTVLGTVHYMSPEQVRGQPLDARTDIFSFGCVLYEMITGQRAFKGDTSADITTAILTQEPATVSATIVDVAPDLDRTIVRCLEKNAQQRFQSSGDLAFTLRSILSGSVSSIASTSGRGVGGWKWAVGALIVMLIVTGGFIFRSILSPVEPIGRIDSLLVLPFVVQRGDTDAEFLGEGIAESVINSLLTMPNLRVIPRNTAMRYRGREQELDEIALELDVRAVLTGRVREIDGRLIVRASLEDTKYQRQIWGEEYDRPRSDILTIERDIARRISDALRLQLTGEDVARRDKQHTDNPDAYMAYAQGRFWCNKFSVDGYKKAIFHFGQAIEKDPTYAPAYAELGHTYVLMGGWYGDMPPLEAFPKAKRAAMKAVEIDATLAEAHCSLAFGRFVYEWDWRGAEEKFVYALGFNPDCATAHSQYAVLLHALGRFDEAQAERRRALELEPLSPIIHTAVGWGHAQVGDYEQAIKRCQEALRLDSSFPPAFQALGYTYLSQRAYEDAIAAFQQATLTNRNAHALGWLGLAYALAGKRTEAVATLDELEQVSTTGHGRVAAAMVHAALGHTDRAFEFLEIAYDERESQLVWLNTVLSFDSLRADPRFDDLLRRVGLEAVSRTRPAPSLAVKSKTEKIKLVVLPFEDISPSPEAWFSDGLTETLIGKLSRLAPDELSVIASTTAMQYKGTDKRVRQIGRELNIEYVVEGRIQRIGDRIRIFAKLVRVSDEMHIWSQDYDRKIDDVFALQSEVAGRIAEGIQLELTPSQEAQLARAKPVDPDVIDAYLRGIAAARVGTRRSCRSAVRMFDRALEIDPEFVLAHVGRAQAFVTLGEFHVPPRESMPHAKAAALDALALDDALPEALTALGYVQLEYEWDFASAKETFQLAMKLNPSLTAARLGFARYLSAMKRGDEALAQLDQVRERDPASVYTDDSHGTVAFMARRFDRVIRDCSSAINVDPEFWKARMWLGLAHGQLREFGEGIHHLRKALTASDGSPVVAAMLGSVLAISGEREEAREIVDALKEKERTDYVCPYELATIWIGLEDHDEAFEEMDRACDGRAPCMPWLQVDPRLDPIRSDPRFDRLLRRVGFEPETRLLEFVEAPREKIMLAVLPFENMSPEPQEWFSDGMTEEMIARLGRLKPKKLGVIARTSVMRYKNTTKGIDQIGRELSVEYILEGSVLRVGERVRITAQLIQVSDQTHLWADTYDRTTQDVFAIQSDVARRVAEALAVALLPEDQSTLDREPTASSVAHDAYLKGLYHWNQRTESSLQRAVQFFESAVETDADFALAHVGLALAHTVLAGHGYLAPSVAFARVKDEAEKAISLDPTLGEAHLARAIYRSYQWNHRAAEEDLREAIRLNPAHPTTRQWYAEFLTGEDRFEEALAQIKQAQRLDPASRIINAAVGMIYYRAHRFDEAVEQTLRALDFAPNFPFAHFVLGRCYAEMGLFEDAVAEINQAIALGERSIEYVAALGYVHARAGRVDEAKRILDELDQRSRTQYVSAYHIARVYAGLGDVDEAFRSLDRAYDERAFEIGWILRSDPSFKSFHGDPRFDDLLDRIGFGPRALNEFKRSGERPE